MSHTRKTLQLASDSWDITLDGLGRISVAKGEYATAQNVANELRLFANDAYFIQDKGVPYFATTLGSRINGPLLRSYLRRAALSVPGVQEVLTVEVTGFDPEQRKISGEVTFTYADGAETGTASVVF